MSECELDSSALGRKLLAGAFLCRLLLACVLVSGHSAVLLLSMALPASPMSPGLLSLMLPFESLGVPSFLIGDFNWRPCYCTYDNAIGVHLSLLLVLKGVPPVLCGHRSGYFLVSLRPFLPSLEFRTTATTSYSDDFQPVYPPCSSLC